MKLVKKIFVVMMIVSLAACKSDDDNPSYELTNANLTGTYEVTMLTNTEIETTDVNGLDIITEYTSIGDTFQLNIVFTDSGTTILDGEYRNSYTETVAGQLIDQGSEIIVVENETINYSVNNSTNTMILDGELYSVSLFNENELRITSEEIYVENGNDIVSTSEIRMIRI